MDAAICVQLRAMRVGRRCPIAAERMDMTTREPKAPAKTSSRGWRMARIAEMRKVLSPISENIIMAKDCSKASGLLSSLPSGSLVGAMTAVGERSVIIWCAVYYHHPNHRPGVQSRFVTSAVDCCFAQAVYVPVIMDTTHLAPMLKYCPSCSL